MTDIDIPANCGHSPKARTLQDLLTGIALADAELIEPLLSGDAQWLPVGARAVSGAKAVARALVRHGPAASLIIHHIVVHGRSGAADGISQYGRKRRAFYLVADFTAARGERIRKITSFSADVTRTSVPAEGVRRSR